VWGRLLVSSFLLVLQARSKSSEDQVGRSRRFPPEQLRHSLWR
jgi:hypothetical protein